MTRVGRLIAGGCLVLAAAAACGSPAESTGSAGAAGTTVPGAPTLTESPAPVLNTTTQALPTGPRSPVPSSKVRDIDPTRPPHGVEVTQDGRSIVFGEPQSGCQHVTAALLAQTAKAVTIQVRTVTTDSGGQLCPMIVREVPLTVRLSAPLGDRQIVFQHAEPITSNH